GVHLGRYGADADGIADDNTRVLNDLYVGYETLVRGYASDSFEVNECTSTDTDPCPEYGRLFGSRLAVANLELRIPLLGTGDFGLINFPYAPVELSPFFDAGLAWSSGESPTLEWATNTPERVPVFSAGVSARINLLGFMVMETYYAYPFQRPDQGWHWGFVISPGW